MEATGNAAVKVAVRRHVWQPDGDLIVLMVVGHQQCSQDSVREPMPCLQTWGGGFGFVRATWIGVCRSWPPLHFDGQSAAALGGNDVDALLA